VVTNLVEKKVVEPTTDNGQNRADFASPDTRKEHTSFDTVLSLKAPRLTTEGRNYESPSEGGFQLANNGPGQSKADLLNALSMEMQLSNQLIGEAAGLENRLNNVATRYLNRSTESVVAEENQFRNIRKKIALFEAKNPGVSIGRTLHPANIDEIISRRLDLDLSQSDMQTLLTMRTTMNIESMYATFDGPIIGRLKQMRENDILLRQQAPSTYSLHKEYGLESVVVELANGNISPDQYRDSISQAQDSIPKELLQQSIDWSGAIEFTREMREDLTKRLNSMKSKLNQYQVI